MHFPKCSEANLLIFFILFTNIYIVKYFYIGSMYNFLSCIYLKAKPSFVTSVFYIRSILHYINDLCHLFTCPCSHGPINSPRTGAVPYSSLCSPGVICGGILISIY